MKTNRRSFLAGTMLLSLPLVFGSYASRGRNQDRHRNTFRWDIISLQPPPPAAPRDVLPGGIASALTNNGSRITLTGSGTFELEKPGKVAGGGTFEIHDKTGALRVSGNYEVTRLVRFEVAPGTTPDGNVDRIAPPETVRAGLAVFEIQYSDDTAGTLVVSCHLMGTSDAVFEGITATKDFVGFWNREAPANGVDANRTAFHVLSDD
jgi:hypothetical protein